MHSLRKSNVICLSVSVSYLNIIYLSLLDARNILLKKRFQRGQVWVFRQARIAFGRIKGFFKAFLFGKKKVVLPPTPIDTRFLNDRIAPVCNTDCRQPTISCSTGLAFTEEAYPFIQDFKEEENIILFHSKVGFSFREMAEWNENVSI